MLNKRILIDKIHEALDQLDFNKVENLKLNEIKRQYIKILKSLVDLEDFSEVLECFTFIEENWNFLEKIMENDSKYKDYFLSLFYYGTNFELTEEKDTVLITNAINCFDANEFTIIEDLAIGEKGMKVVLEGDKYHLNKPDYEYFIANSPGTCLYNIYRRTGERMLQIKPYDPDFAVILCKVVNNNSKFKFDVEYCEDTDTYFIHVTDKEMFDNEDDDYVSVGYIYEQCDEEFGMCHLCLDNPYQSELLYLVCVAILLAERNY